MPLCWIDLETTGLNADADNVLEVACIITDDKLEELGRWSQVIRLGCAKTIAAVYLNDEAAIAAVADYYSIDPYVVKMHLANGLWAECAAPGLPEHNKVDEQLAAFIQAHCPETGERKGPQLAGSTISFDRAFLRVDMPQSHGLLHYRNLDTTTLNELARRFWPELHAARPAEVKGHRAMADIEYSIWIAKYYASRLGPIAL